MRLISEARATLAVLAVPALLAPVALLAVLVTGNSGTLVELDRQITDRLHATALADPVLVETMHWWSLIFHPNVWRVAALGLVIWLVRRGARGFALWVAVTMTAGGLLGVLLKLLVGRERPDLLEPVARAAGYAFPSGHALNNALGAAVFLTVLLPLTRGRPVARAGLWLAAVTIPLVTAASRVVLGVHWASDVLAGLLLGVAVVASTAVVFERRFGAQVSRET